MPYLRRHLSSELEPTYGEGEDLTVGRNFQTQGRLEYADCMKISRLVELARDSSDSTASSKSSEEAILAAAKAMTFASEGDDSPGSPFFSRVPHVPSAGSGVTLGRGYDMKARSSAKIIAELVKAGLVPAEALKFGPASGLSGARAKLWLVQMKLTKFTISTQQQASLFNISYAAEASEAERVASKKDVQDKYGYISWNAIHPAIRGIIIDLKYRGDYSPALRSKMQKFVAVNDTKGVYRVISDDSYWKSVKLDTNRFEKRIEFFKRYMDASWLDEGRSIDEAEFGNLMWA